jgi:ribosomal protein S27AE
MEQLPFGRKPNGEVILDVCWDCRAIWFDQYESAALTPGSVIALFREIHERRESSARPLADAMACPRCTSKLVLTQDIQRTNRLTYHRCTDGHGRFTTFFQFLREKQFIRSLSALEIDSLRATVKQVRCSSCGATVDLARDNACGYCRAPISVLDAEAVEKTLAGLTQAERRRTQPSAAELASAFESLVATHKTAAKGSVWTRDITSTQPTTALVDLVVEGIGHLLFK